MFDEATEKKLFYDMIVSEPTNPWISGVGNLYTREFFEACKAHLRPGGVVTLFVQLYETNEAVVRSELRTFFDAFPHSVVLGNLRDGEGYVFRAFETTDE